jgi:hypothetical protein
MQAVTIRYETTSNGKIKEKTFASEAAMQKWCEKQGDAVAVLAYSYGPTA